MLVDLFNGLISIFAFIANTITSLLPQTPFQFQKANWGVFGDAIGFVFPVGQMATHMALILGAFGMYYAVRWVLRMIRQIQ